MSDKCCATHAHPNEDQAINIESSEGDSKTDSQVTTFSVAGMDCADEIQAIQASLRIDGVHRVNASLMSSSVTIHHDERLTPSYLKKVVNSAGVRVVDEANQAHGIARFRVALVFASGLFALLSIFFEMVLVQEPAVLVFSSLSVLCGGILVFPKALRAIRTVHLDMNVLMAVAVVGAFVIGEHSEAAMVVFLFSLSELLEAFSVGRARKAIREVLALAPKTATRLKPDGSHETVSVENLGVGDRIVIKPGENIPSDGQVESGLSQVNQAPLTGESVPVEKNVGDQVYAGTINESGVLTVVVRALANDSKLSRVVRLIEDAQKQKAPSERFVDRFARIYTPAVFVIATLTAILPPLIFAQGWDIWVYRALVLLVVACPCALVIATPISIVTGLTAMAKRGVLVKGGNFLEALGSIRALAIDKTGTVTEGKPKVVQVIAINATADETVRIAASIEKLSSHPLAKAIVSFADEKTLKLEMVTTLKNIPGRGIEARLNGEMVYLGNHKYFHELGLCSTELEKAFLDIESQALSVVAVGKKDARDGTSHVLGLIAVGDRIRSNSADAIRALHAAGIEHIVMLSGDNFKTASAIGKTVGVDDVKGDLLPDDKVLALENLLSRYKNVAMVGDGINDAPALARATVGIAMGAVGTDTAIETADVALMNDDLSQVAVAIHLGRRTKRLIQFNIGFAIAIKIAFLIAALLGKTNLWFAVAADTGATLLVIANSLRLLSTRDDFFPKR